MFNFKIEWDMEPEHIIKEVGETHTVTKIYRATQCKSINCDRICEDAQYLLCNKCTHYDEQKPYYCAFCRESHDRPDDGYCYLCESIVYELREPRVVVITKNRDN